MTKDLKNYNGVYVITNFLDSTNTQYISQTIQPLLEPSEDPLVQCALGFFKRSEAKMISMNSPVIAMSGDIVIDQFSQTITSILLDIKNIMANVYNTQLDFSRLLYNKMMVGKSIPLHTDFITKVHNYNNFTALLYINGSGIDYMGGEIHFPNQGLSFAPQAGTLVFFQGNEDVPHTVTKILSGQRENIIMSFSSRSEE
jgi:hypothetical protein